MTTRERIVQASRSNDLDGILVTSPENFYYATGVSPHQLSVSRIPGFAYAFLDLRPQQKDAIITMDYEAPAFSHLHDRLEVIAYDTWVGVKTETEWRSGQDLTHKTRLLTALDQLKILIERRELTKARIGLEMKSIPVHYYQLLSQALPEIEWIDVSDDFILARSVKTAPEIELYRDLCRASDEALLAVSRQVAIGRSETELIQIYRETCMANGHVPSSWSMLGSGPYSSVLQLATDKTIRDGDCVRFDGGCEAGFQFYKTDFSRTWIIGQADPELIQLKQVLVESQRKMIDAIKPGLRFSDLFRLGYESVKQHVPNYTRGHLGHSISLGPQTADAPLISATEDRLIEPGMILCVEVPFYMAGFNGFNIEDMVVVTEGGCDVLTYRTPHYLPGEQGNPEN